MGVMPFPVPLVLGLFDNSWTERALCWDAGVLQLRQIRDLSVIRQIPIVMMSLAAMAAVGSLSSCACSNVGDSENGERMPGKTIEQVLKENTDEWMAIPGVEGTAIGMFEGRPCIKIFSSINPQELRSKIPSTVENYPVIIEETGAFRALDSP